MTLKYFKRDEFDSPDKPGSGEMMDDNFLERLDIARDIYGYPMIVTSGFRSIEYQRELIERGLKAAKNSSHLLGLAADIYCDDSRKRYLMVEAFLDAGFRRIGIGSTFIHVDLDEAKPQDVIWTY
jgi:uncharacterized protein YcbK (DUF882 family)|tara:strand:+ start:537 stop:911 length:375 start_codon:yes stop_codon:yes gene_type:complete